jgi:hypothetical protein
VGSFRELTKNRGWDVECPPGAVGSELVCHLSRESLRRQLQAHEIVDTRSVPIIVNKKIEGTTERSHAAREPSLEIVPAFATASSKSLYGAPDG